MSNGTSPPVSQPDDRRSDRLDSWKDIAGYLQRDVTTVQRWEKREGMPVHRHIHEKLGTIYAFRSELEAWNRSRGPSVAGQPAKEPAADAAAGRTRWTRSRLAAIAIGAIAAVAAVGYGVRFAGRAAATPVNPAAYDAVQRARYLSVRTTDEDSRAAIGLLEQAIALEPGFAPAYGALASALVIRLAYVTPDETRDLEQRAFAAAEKALSLDPNLPEAYLARGDLLWSHSQRFAHERAVQEFRRALALNPKSDQAHRKLARVYVHLGYFEDAIQHANSALAINPTDAQALNSRAQATLWIGKDEEALAELLSIPGPVLPELVEANTAFALFRLGRRDEAAGYLSQAMRKHPDDPSGNLPAMRALLLAESDPQAASSLLAVVGSRKALNPSHHAAYLAASASARMRHAREAVEWLRQAADTGFPCYELFARDPNLDPIRHDPQFVEFMTELQKRSAAMRKALFPDRP
jgi:tetratricopeptide (TPR) repeat protein